MGKSIGDENCLENSRALTGLEGSTPSPSAKYMNITEISTLYSWINNRLTVTEHRTEHFKNGNDVQTVVQRSYEVTLYSKQGQEEQYSSKGSNIDLKA